MVWNWWRAGEADAPRIFTYKGWLDVIAQVVLLTILWFVLPVDHSFIPKTYLLSWIPYVILEAAEQSSLRLRKLFCGRC
jgi:hypothetical protein